MKKKFNREKIGKGEEWLEGPFLENVIPNWFEGCNPQISFDEELEEDEYHIEHDLDGNGANVVFMNYRPKAHQNELFAMNIEKNYNQMVAPFEHEANKMGWDVQILGGEDGVWTFEVTVY